jgi:hypothetical protein
LVFAAFREALPHYDVSNRSIEVFLSAGLPLPILFREIPTGGGENSPLYAWLADTMPSMLPQLARMGIVIDEMSIGTLENTLRMAVVEARSQIEGPAQVCAWAKI